MNLIIAGAAPDTANLGVSALLFSLLQSLSEHAPAAKVTIFDNGFGERQGAFPGIEGLDIRLVGVRRTRRLYARESWQRVSLSIRLRDRSLPAARALLEADCVLDFSGGDSFTDIHGMHRFRAIVSPKLAALRAGVPLVLLPQTYGPFKESRTREIAAKIFCRSRLIIARDMASKHRALALSTDDTEVHEGVDAAFLLAAMKPPDVETLPREGRHVIGINVSGLLYNDTTGFYANRYGLICNYRDVVNRFIGDVLACTDHDIVLVPHVVTRPGHFESDIEACHAAAACISRKLQDRVSVTPAFQDPRHVKWIISHCDWFCGTRMHSTIAALSSGVPTAAISYSDKTLGVFETCGQGDLVADPRVLDAPETTDHLLASFNQRHAARASLVQHLPSVLSTAHSQMDDIAAACAGAHAI